MRLTKLLVQLSQCGTAAVTSALTKLFQLRQHLWFVSTSRLISQRDLLHAGDTGHSFPSILMAVRVLGRVALQEASL